MATTKKDSKGRPHVDLAADGRSREAPTQVLPVRVGNSLISARVVGRNLDGSGVAGEAQVSRDRVLDFGDVATGIEDMSRTFVSVLQKVAPDKWSVEFNVGVAVKGGKLTALFFDADVKGSVKVLLQWDGTVRQRGGDEEDDGADE